MELKRSISLSFLVRFLFSFSFSCQIFSIRLFFFFLFFLILFLLLRLRHSFVRSLVCSSSGLLSIQENNTWDVIRCIDFGVVCPLCARVFAESLLTGDGCGCCCHMPHLRRCRSCHGHIARSYSPTRCLWYSCSYLPAVIVTVPARQSWVQFVTSPIDCKCTWYICTAEDLPTLSILERAAAIFRPTTDNIFASFLFSSWKNVWNEFPVYMRMHDGLKMNGMDIYSR